MTSDERLCSICATVVKQATALRRSAMRNLDGDGVDDAKEASRRLGAATYDLMDELDARMRMPVERDPEEAYEEIREARGWE